MNYDLIGDIHGHADKLVKLLSRLGYVQDDGAYRADGREAIFVGDLIDRGKQNREVISIVRKMVERGHARVVMGNHEYNAICFHAATSEGDFLRPHNEKNCKQHAAFLREYPLGQRDTDEVIEWFKTLPLFLDCDHFRVIHACWDSASIALIKDKTIRYFNDDYTLKEDHLAESATKETPLFSLIETLLKGVEVDLPKSCTFKDKDNIERNTIRIQWWRQSENLSYRKLAFGYDEDVIKNLPNDLGPDKRIEPLYRDPIPVFFGHYWLSDNQDIQQHNICCLDYSAGQGGKLAGYRFAEDDANMPLSPNRFMVHE